MSNIKISQLPSAGALSGAEILPIVQAGDTKSTSINSIVSQAPTQTLQAILDNNNDLLNGINLQGTGAGDANTGAANINAFGTNAAKNNTQVSINALGYQAAMDNTGTRVNALGDNAASSNSGQYVNAFGSNAGVGNIYNSVNLFGVEAKASADNQMVLSKELPSPSYAHINARISFTNITDNRKYELPDASGTLALLSDIPTSSGWGLTGNAGTTAGTNFIGTTDNQDLVIKTDGTEQLRLKSMGGSGNIETPSDIYSKNNYGGSFITARSTSGSNGGATIGWDDTNKGYVSIFNGTILGIIKASNLTTTNKTYQLPDADGTLALTSDIGAGYKSYVAIVDFSGSGFAQTILKNDFSGITFTWSNPTTSVLRITPSTAVTFTNNKTVVFVNSYENDYFVTPKRANNPALDYVNLSHTKYDGTTNTMVYGKFYIEIRVYP